MPSIFRIVENCSQAYKWTAGTLNVLFLELIILGTLGAELHIG